MANLQKWVHLSFLACGLVAWLLLRELYTLAFDPLGWMRFDWIVLPNDIAGIFSGVILFIFLLRSQKTNEFLSSALAELSKVTWPARKETALSTGVVSILVAVATLCLLLFDSVWSWISEGFIY